MAKKNQPEVSKQEKVQTKYDRKIEARKKKEAKDKKNDLILKVSASVIGLVIVVAIAASAVFSIVKKNTALHDTYVTVGSHDLTKVQYDYYYNSTVNNYLTTYGDLLGYMGVDPQKDFGEQQYSETMTWKDLFDQMAVEQIKQTKALADAAADFTYDGTEDYKNVVSSIEESAKTAEVSVSQYYKNTYGQFATEKNTAPTIKEGLLAAAYYEDIFEKNKPAEDEVKKYYEDNKQNYDKVDYSSFVFTAEAAEDATEEDIAAAVDAIKEKADAFAEKRKGGTGFEALCLEYATEEQKGDYEPADTEYSFNKGKYFSGISNSISSWLYDDARKEGDINVIVDDASRQCYVVEFYSKYFDEADNTNISNTIADQKSSLYLNGLMESYTVTDKKGELKFLTIESEPEVEAETDTKAETEAGAEANTGADVEGTAEVEEIVDTEETE